MESPTHKKLVKALVEKFEKDGVKVTHAALAGYKAPYKIGRHEPDIIAQDSRGVLLIGEAKTKDDLDSETSKEQFIDFSNRVMASGQMENEKLSLHIIVEEEGYLELKRVLEKLRLNSKNNIKIWLI